MLLAMRRNAGKEASLLLRLLNADLAALHHETNVRCEFFHYSHILPMRPTLVPNPLPLFRHQSTQRLRALGKGSDSTATNLNLDM